MHKPAVKIFSRQVLNSRNPDPQKLMTMDCLGLLDLPEKHSHRRTGVRALRAGTPSRKIPDRQR